MSLIEFAKTDRAWLVITSVLAILFFILFLHAFVSKCTIQKDYNHMVDSHLDIEKLELVKVDSSTTSRTYKFKSERLNSTSQSSLESVAKKTNSSARDIEDVTVLEYETSNTLPVIYKTDTIYVRDKNLDLEISKDTASYTYNGKITTTLTRERKNIFSKYDYYTNVVSDSKNFKVNGVRRYRKMENIPKDIISLRAGTRVSYLKEGDLRGSSFLSLDILPDNRVTYNIKYGYTYGTNVTGFSSFCEAGVNVDILKF